MRDGIFPAVSVNKGYHSHKQWWPPRMVSWQAPRALRKERARPSSSHQTAATTEGEPGGTPGRENNRVLAPDSWGVHQSNDFSEPRLFYLPIRRKALNSLTWDSWFSLTGSSIWGSDYPPFVAKLLYNLVSPPFSSEQFSWGYLRCCLLRLSPKNIWRIKHNSQHLGCVYIFGR